MFGRKKKTTMTWKEVKEAFAKLGEMPVTWECGNDESIVILQGWGKWKKNHPHESALGMLCEKIIDKLSLPNAGPLMDEGDGKIFYDAASKKLKITYSSKCVVYEMYGEQELKPGYEDQRGVTLALPDMQAETFRFYAELENPEQVDDWFSLVVVEPKISNAATEVLKKALEESFRPFLNAFAETKNAEVSSEVGEVILKGGDFEGAWSAEEGVLTYDLYPSIEYIATVAKDKTVTLA